MQDLERKQQVEFQRDLEEQKRMLESKQQEHRVALEQQRNLAQDQVRNSNRTIKKNISSHNPKQLKGSSNARAAGVNFNAAADANRSANEANPGPDGVRTQSQERPGQEPIDNSD